MLAVLASSPLLTIFLVVAFGALLGAVRFGPIRFGAAAALFVGLAVGALDPRLGQGLGLVQSLGLALFVYTVGLAAGHTFFRDLRSQLPLMGGAGLVLVVVTGVAVVVGGALGLSPAMSAGTFAGALTSTPALATAAERSGAANIAGATWVAGRRCSALISLSSARLSEAAAVASQAIATSTAPAASSSVSSLLAIAVQA